MCSLNRGRVRNSRTASIQTPGGFEYPPRSRNAEAILMEWFLNLTVRAPLAVHLVAQMQ